VWKDHNCVVRDACQLAESLHAGNPLLNILHLPLQGMGIIGAELLMIVVISVDSDRKSVWVLPKKQNHGGLAAVEIPRNERQCDVEIVQLGLL
jgi:hypothetical protein